MKVVGSYNLVLFKYPLDWHIAAPLWSIGRECDNISLCEHSSIQNNIQKDMAASPLVPVFYFSRVGVVTPSSGYKVNFSTDEWYR